MDPAKIRQVIKKGEGIAVEFKACKNALSKDIFETTRAFLNRSGGELLIGVSDGGKVAAIEELKKSVLQKAFTGKL